MSMNMMNGNSEAALTRCYNRKDVGGDGSTSTSRPAPSRLKPVKWHVLVSVGVGVTMSSWPWMLAANSDGTSRRPSASHTAGARQVEGAVCRQKKVD